MADFGAPVAGGNTYTPQAPGATLAQLFALKQAKANAQMTQQDATQRAQIAAIMKDTDWQKYAAPDGTLDMNKVMEDPSIRQAAGDKFPEVMQQLLAVKSGQLTAKQQLVNLNDSTRKQLQEMLGGLRTDPDVVSGNQKGVQKIQTAVSQFAATSPDAARIASIYAVPLAHTPPNQMAQMLSNMQLQAQAAAQQSVSEAPQYVSTGTGLTNVNPQAAQGGGATLTNTPPLSSNVAEVQNIQKQAAADQATYSSTVTAGNEAPQTKNILKNIQALAGETTTGPGSQTLADAETVLGQYIPGFSGATDQATKRQLLGKYVEQLAMRVTQANGYATDDARNLVTHAIPDPTKMTPDAIKKAAQFIQGQTEISQARASFANNYMQTHGSSLGFQKADAEFMQNIDPRMFDFIGLPADQRQAWIKKTFGDDKKALQEFTRKFRTVTELGGFNYETQ